MKAKLIFIFIIMLMIIGGCDNSQSTQSEISESEREQAVALLKEEFYVPDGLFVGVSKIVTGPESGKWDIICEMEAYDIFINNILQNLSPENPNKDEQIMRLQRLQNHKRELQAQLERGEYNNYGTFYEGKSGKDIYWLFYDTEGNRLHRIIVGKKSW